jgi:hypothetical protein
VFLPDGERASIVDLWGIDIKNPHSDGVMAPLHTVKVRAAAPEATARDVRAAVSFMMRLRDIVCRRAGVVL